ncbi:DNA glycosylase [Nemania sp. FL0916]|nr:DNA glycosylase [Nemania sp. FL0916]
MANFAGPTSQSVLVLRSPFSRRILPTATSPYLRLEEASSRITQPPYWNAWATLKNSGRKYQTSCLEPRNITRPTVTSHSCHSRGFTPHLTSNKIFQTQPAANMSTRRSARLVAASEAQASSAPSDVAAPPPPAPKSAKGRKRKAVSDAAGSDEPATKKAPAKAKAKAATTTKRRRTQKESTPTPTTAELMAEPAAPGEAIVVPTTPRGRKPRAAAVDRLADSNKTLATLLSPETSRVVTNTMNAVTEDQSPPASPTAQLKGSIPAPVAAATANILEEANRYLVSVDERMRPLVENHHCRVFSPEGLAEKVDPFESLCSGIISQQVSGAAAKSIKRKFIALFHEGEGESEEKKESETKDGWEGVNEAEPRFPHPSEVVGVPLEKLRTAGLSQRKAEYVSGLAERFVSGELSAQILADASYEEVIERLTAVRGLGLWSAEMFAFFGLKRIDVFSLGDLGVQRGCAAFVGRDIAKLKNSKGGKFKYMSEKDMTELADRFRPYRSLFMWYMWRVEPTDVSTME